MCVILQTRITKANLMKSFEKWCGEMTIPSTHSVHFSCDVYELTFETQFGRWSLCDFNTCVATMHALTEFEWQAQLLGSYTLIVAFANSFHCLILITVIVIIIWLQTKLGPRVNML